MSEFNFRMHDRMFQSFYWSLSVQLCIKTEKPAKIPLMYLSDRTKVKTRHTVRVQRALYNYEVI